ncbi:hypothetical protein Tco_0808127 [Tanacetum coccineum]
MSAKLHTKPRIVGSSQGLFFLYGNDVGTPSYSGIETLAIWNPAIRKLVDIDQLPHVDGNVFYATVGFGVCPHTLEFPFHCFEGHAWAKSILQSGNCSNNLAILDDAFGVTGKSRWMVGVDGYGFVCNESGNEFSIIESRKLILKRGCVLVGGDGSNVL